MKASLNQRLANNRDILLVYITFITYLTIVVWTGLHIHPSSITREELTNNRESTLSMTNALEAYKVNNGRYPETLETLMPEYLENILFTTRNFPFYYRYRQEQNDYFLCVTPDKDIDGGGNCCYTAKDDFWDCSPFGDYSHR